MRVLATVSLASCAVLLATSAFQAGILGLAASSMGMVGTALYLGATWLLVRLVGRAVSGDQVPRGQALAALFALAAKVPLILLGWIVSKDLGPFGPTWFLAGLGLVYCLTVWRAVLAARD